MGPALSSPPSSLQGPEVGEHFVGMASHVRDPIGLPDHALGVDEVRPPLRPFRAALGRVSLRLVKLADPPILVGEEPEVEPLFPGKGPVDLRRVERRAQDDRAGPLELGGSVPEPLSLPRSPGSGRLDEPPQDYPSPPLVREGHGNFVLVRQREVGCLGPLAQHEAESRAACATLAQ